MCYEVCRTCARQVCRCVTRCGGIVPGPSAIRTAQAVSDAWHSCSVGVCRSSDRCLLPAPEKITFSPGGVRRASQKADSTLRSSRAVPHPSTNRALRHLTSEVRRDRVHSTRYGRQQQPCRHTCLRGARTDLHRRGLPTFRQGLARGGAVKAAHTNAARANTHSLALLRHVRPEPDACGIPHKS